MEAEKPKFKLLHLPKNQDVLMNKIEVISEMIEASPDFAYVDEIIMIAINKLYNLDYEFSHELNRAADKLQEARFWLNEFLDVPEAEQNEKTS